MNTDTKPTSGDDKRAHLAMTQGVINRMGGNLFFLKGWAITLMAALFAATISFNTNLCLQLTLAGAIIFFWGFDADGDARYSARRAGFWEIGAYLVGSHHHARGACEVNQDCCRNRFERGCI